VSSANAECAWVLWHEINVSSFDKLGRFDRSEQSVQDVLASSDERICWTGALERAKAEGSRKADSIPGFPPLTATVEAGTNAVTTTYRRPVDGTVIYTSAVRWFCL